MNILKLNDLTINKPFCKDEKIIRQRNVYDIWYISDEFSDDNSNKFYKLFFEDTFICFLCKEEINYLIDNGFIEIRSIK
jgi:hypothetical protein